MAARAATAEEAAAREETAEEVLAARGLHALLRLHRHAVEVTAMAMVLVLRRSRHR